MIPDYILAEAKILGGYVSHTHDNKLIFINSYEAEDMCAWLESEKIDYLTDPANIWSRNYEITILGE